MFTELAILLTVLNLKIFHIQRWGMYEVVESLYYTPGTNMTLYVNHTGIKAK